MGLQNSKLVPQRLKRRKGRRKARWTNDIVRLLASKHLWVRWRKSFAQKRGLSWQRLSWGKRKWKGYVAAYAQKWAEVSWSSRTTALVVNAANKVIINESMIFTEFLSFLCLSEHMCVISCASASRLILCSNSPIIRVEWFTIAALIRTRYSVIYSRRFAQLIRSRYPPYLNSQTYTIKVYKCW